MSAFVLDVSASLCWCFGDLHALFGEQLLADAATSGAWVPSLWHAEWASALHAAQRRGLLEAAELRRLSELFDRLPIRTDDAAPESARREALRLAQDTGLGLFRAIYLELALRRQLPLATLDAPLLRAASRLRVPTLAP